MRTQHGHSPRERGLPVLDRGQSQLTPAGVGKHRERRSRSGSGELLTTARPHPLRVGAELAEHSPGELEPGGPARVRDVVDGAAGVDPLGLLGGEHLEDLPGERGDIRGRSPLVVDDGERLPLGLEADHRGDEVTAGDLQGHPAGAGVEPRRAQDRRLGQLLEHGPLPRELGTAVDGDRARRVVGLQTGCGGGIATAGHPAGEHVIGADVDHPDPAVGTSLRQVAGAVDVDLGRAVLIGLRPVDIGVRRGVDHHVRRVAVQHRGDRPRVGDVQLFPPRGDGPVAGLTCELPPELTASPRYEDARQSAPVGELPARCTRHRLPLDHGRRPCSRRSISSRYPPYPDLSRSFARAASSSSSIYPIRHATSSGDPIFRPWRSSIVRT